MAMPGGSDYLAGIGPPPPGLSAADLANPAPIIRGAALPGPIGSQASQYIRANAPQGFGSLFGAFNALGYKPPTANSPLNQFYQNGTWGAPNLYSPGGAASVPRPATPLQANIAATTQTQFAPTGSTNPNMNSALMQYNPAQAIKPLPFTLNSNSNYDAMRNAAATAPGASGLGYPPFKWPNK